MSTNVPLMLGAQTGFRKHRTKSLKTIAVRSLLVLVVIAMSGCQEEVSYQPPILPVKLTIDSQGNISVKGELSLVTAIGKFSIGAKYSLSRDEDSILVIIRDRRQGDTGFDSIYSVRSGKDEFVAVVNGKTTIQVVNKQILIDVTDGSVESIEFRKASGAIPVDGIIWQPWPLGYHPFALAEWAYDDSTIGQWCGLGFLWFLLRLVLSGLLAVIDIVLIIILGIGVVLHTFFGITVRNIYFGLLFIGVIALDIISRPVEGMPITLWILAIPVLLFSWGWNRLKSAVDEARASHKK